MDNVFPYILIILQIGAGVMSACAKDWRMAAYWFFAAGLNIAVTI